MKIPQHLRFQTASIHLLGQKGGWGTQHRVGDKGGWGTAHLNGKERDPRLPQDLLRGANSIPLK